MKTPLTLPTDNGIESLALRALSPLYAVGRLAHRGIYNAGILRRNRLPCRVVCVGNLTVGGTGKTPFLIYLASELQSRGLRPAILSRGYGAQPTAAPPRVVSDGVRLTGDATQNGDEPTLLGKSCPGVPVVIGTSRFEAGKLALAQFEPDVLLLDDGFQHEALARDADLALWDLRDIPSRMHQIPGGRLREGLGALARASAIILTHAESLPHELRDPRRAQVIRELKLHAPSVPVFEAATTFSGIRKLQTDGKSKFEIPRSKSETMPAGKRVLLVSGLARPEGFESTMIKAGFEVARHLIYTDHATYTDAEVAQISSTKLESRADFVLTTEKDAVKLERLNLDGLEIYAAGIAMQPLEPERWQPFVDDVLSRPVQNGA